MPTTAIKLDDILLCTQPTEEQAKTIARGVRKAFERLYADGHIAQMPVIRVGHLKDPAL